MIQAGEEVQYKLSATSSHEKLGNMLFTTYHLTPHRTNSSLIYRNRFTLRLISVNNMLSTEKFMEDVKNGIYPLTGLHFIH